MASDDDDLAHELLRGLDNKDAGQPQPDESRPNEQRPGEQRPEGGPSGYEVLPQPDDGKELGDKLHERRRRRKRGRSILEADKPLSPLTIKQGWLDGLFTFPYVVLVMAVAFFFFPLVIPVAIFAAITAHDWEARKNAFMVMAFCLLPMLVLSCLYCIAITTR